MSATTRAATRCRHEQRRLTLERAGHHRRRPGPAHHHRPCGAGAALPPHRPDRDRTDRGGRSPTCGSTPLPRGGAAAVSRHVHRHHATARPGRDRRRPYRGLGRDRPRSRTAAAAAATRPAYKDPHRPVRERGRDLLSRMTLAEKIGQMTQTERYQVFDDDHPDHHLASSAAILSGGGSTPAENTPEAWADMVDRFQRRRAPDPAGHPASVRDRRRARQRQPTRRDGLPAQHRARRHP